MINKNRNKNVVLPVIAIAALAFSSNYIYSVYLSQKDTRQKNRAELYLKLSSDYNNYQRCITQIQQQNMPYIKGQCSGHLLSFSSRAELADTYFNVDSNTEKQIAIIKNNLDKSINSKQVIDISTPAEQILASLKNQVI